MGLFSISNFAESDIPLSLNDDNAKNPLVIDSSFEAKSIGVVIKDFFVKEKRIKSTSEYNYFLIDRQSLETRKISKERYYEEFPKSPLLFPAKYKELFSNKNGTYTLNTGEKLTLLPIKKAGRSFKEDFLVNEKTIQAPAVDTYFNLAYRNKNTLWIFGFSTYLDDFFGDVFSPSGIRLIDLATKDHVITSLSSFGNTWNSFVKKDDFSELVWIGNNYGFYGIDANFKEVKSCFMILSSRKALIKFICKEADYLSDYKKDQGPLLMQKEENMKLGIAKPEYINEVKSNFQTDVKKIKDKLPNASRNKK